MGRILAIDYGRKRVGVAVSDPGKLIATGLQTVRACDVLDFLAEYTGREKVELFVVGHPKQMDKRFPEIPVVMYDERFTSVLAHRALIEGGAKRKTRQDKGLIDTMSATIILTSYMEQQRNLGM